MPNFCSSNKKKIIELCLKHFDKIIFREFFGCISQSFEVINVFLERAFFDIFKTFKSKSCL